MHKFAIALSLVLATEAFAQQPPKPSPLPPNSTHAQLPLEEQVQVLKAERTADNAAMQAASAASTLKSLLRQLADKHHCVGITVDLDCVMTQPEGQSTTGKVPPRKDAK